jgi:hypothetical protein
MPSIVSFGKIFCKYFAATKFLRDFQRFRKKMTLLLRSGSALGPGGRQKSTPLALRLLAAGSRRIGRAAGRDS